MPKSVKRFSDDIMLCFLDSSRNFGGTYMIIVRL